MIAAENVLNSILCGVVRWWAEFVSPGLVSLGVWRIKHVWGSRSAFIPTGLLASGSTHTDGRVGQGKDDEFLDGEWWEARAYRWAGWNQHTRWRTRRGAKGIGSAGAKGVYGWNSPPVEASGLDGYD